MSTSERQVDGCPEPWNSAPCAGAIHSPVGDVTLRDAEGWSFPLDVGRWSGRADPADEAVLERCTGPILDVGCGAGRLVEALARRGHAVLGVDERRRVRIHVGRQAVSPVFSWATVGTRALERHGRLSGWAPIERWTSLSGERHFVALRACA
ncbi:methyltransferase domain-containing protein [Streptomyces sp. H27-G5]|uniref:methyltransferase domain-containing protein n=1 Tax=Streptomyces sp. H27-G5 TaxID=2996698 RepID=UPI002271D1C4|nr:methyltransferase domain-containing protein [Streptomyces sp. H27-G5]MCY0919376.1 methyltransferase domain-containing protein [Streptomyces sp. H27-G5]